jgi:hypothetical protein
MRRLAAEPPEEVVTRRRLGTVIFVTLFLFYVTFRFAQMFIWLLQWLF